MRRCGREQRQQQVLGRGLAGGARSRRSPSRPARARQAAARRWSAASGSSARDQRPRHGASAPPQRARAWSARPRRRRPAPAGRTGRRRRSRRGRPTNSVAGPGLARVDDRALGTRRWSRRRRRRAGPRQPVRTCSGVQRPHALSGRVLAAVGATTARPGRLRELRARRSTSSNGILRPPRTPGPARDPCPAITTTSPRASTGDRRVDRRSPVGVVARPRLRRRRGSRR